MLFWWTFSQLHDYTLPRASVGLTDSMCISSVGSVFKILTHLTTILSFGLL